MEKIIYFDFGSFGAFFFKATYEKAKKQDESSSNRRCEGIRHAWWLSSKLAWKDSRKNPPWPVGWRVSRKNAQRVPATMGGGVPGGASKGFY
ncbi:hypothetical protein C1H46_001661 [Malus baccata]|uniref:Uncharacterized protein n=1 Tax=Malus baccata TaxID=106549 RepID=A0A540NP15_MALBA|nr:hypothetical protein C1H46_001661 [Malus baccata]